MATPHRKAAHPAPGPLQADAVVQPEKETSARDKPAPQEGTPPRAGRTGGLGTRAERPSEGTKCKPEDKNDPVRRGAKAPSAKAVPHSDERSSK